MTTGAVSAGQFGEQLKMFMTAPEILATHHPHVGDKVIPHEEDAATWTRKNMEATESGHTAALQRGLGMRPGTEVASEGGGIDKPVHLTPHTIIDRSAEGDTWGPSVAGGHHRVAALHKMANTPGGFGPQHTAQRLLAQRAQERLLPVVHHEHLLAAQNVNPQRLGPKYKGDEWQTRPPDIFPFS